MLKEKEYNIDMRDSIGCAFLVEEAEGSCVVETQGRKREFRAEKNGDGDEPVWVMDVNPKTGNQTGPT